MACLSLHLAGIDSIGNLWSVIITRNNNFFNVSWLSCCKKWYITDYSNLWCILLFYQSVLIPATVQLKWDTCTLWLVPWFVGAGHICIKLWPVIAEARPSMVASQDMHKAVTCHIRSQTSHDGFMTKHYLTHPKRYYKRVNTSLC